MKGYRYLIKLLRLIRSKSLPPQFMHFLTGLTLIETKAIKQRMYAIPRPNKKYDILER
jgi:hypothetical protein